MKTPPHENTPASAAITTSHLLSINPEQIASALSDALGATSVSRSGVIEPDHRSRLAAVQLILSYTIGRPIERSEVVTVSLEAEDTTGLEDRLRHSPALRAVLENALAKIGDGSINI